MRTSWLSRLDGQLSTIPPWKRRDLWWKPRHSLIHNLDTPFSSQWPFTQVSIGHVIRHCLKNMLIWVTSIQVVHQPQLFFKIRIPFLSDSRHVKHQATLSVLVKPSKNVISNLLAQGQTNLPCRFLAIWFSFTEMWCYDLGSQSSPILHHLSCLVYTPKSWVNGYIGVGNHQHLLDQQERIASKKANGRWLAATASDQFFSTRMFSPTEGRTRQGCLKNHPTNFSQWNADDFSRKGKSIVRKDWPKHVNHVGMASHTVGSVQMVFASLRTGSKCAIYTGLERYLFFHVCCRQFWRWVMGMR